ncbi:20828_t:CDS:1, partial [Dentiscutata erythropus]
MNQSQPSIPQLLVPQPLIPQPLIPQPPQLLVHQLLMPQNAITSSFDDLSAEKKYENLTK